MKCKNVYYVRFSLKAATVVRQRYRLDNNYKVINHVPTIKIHFFCFASILYRNLRMNQFKSFDRYNKKKKKRAAGFSG